MSGVDFILIARIAVLLVYGGIVFVSVIFTFFVNTYLRLDDMFNFEFVLLSVKNPMGKDIDLLRDIDEWLVARNKIIGPLLIVIACVDMAMLFDLLGAL